MWWRRSGLYRWVVARVGFGASDALGAFFGCTGHRLRGAVAAGGLGQNRFRRRQP